MAQPVKRILVVDDEEKIAAVISAYLAQAGYEAHIAASGAQALAAFETLLPSLVILDLMLPDTSGEELCRSLRRRSRVPIIMLTAKAEEEDILKGLDLGADDYVTKPFSPRQLVARVAALLRRSEEDARPLANILSFGAGDLSIDYTSLTVKKQGIPVSLTPNEFKLLSALLKYPNKVFTREELIAAVMGRDFDGYDRIIDTHVKNLRHKIETDPRHPQYIVTVYGVGYRFGGE